MRVEEVAKLCRPVCRPIFASLMIVVLVFMPCTWRSQRSCGGNATNDVGTMY